jgi:hypothetical protein
MAYNCLVIFKVFKVTFMYWLLSHLCILVEKNETIPNKLNIVSYFIPPKIL